MTVRALANESTQVGYAETSLANVFDRRFNFSTCVVKCTKQAQRSAPHTDHEKKGNFAKYKIFSLFVGTLVIKRLIVTAKAAKGGTK